MPSRDELRAISADPQVEGMDRLYEAIGVCIHEWGDEFATALDSVIGIKGPEAEAWLSFCVMSALRLDEPAEESELLCVLEEVTRQHMEQSTDLK